jgi:hypothetical protein
LKFETDEKEHHHDAEFGHMHDVAARLAHKIQDMGSDEHASEEVTKDGTEAKALRQRDGDHGREKIDEGVEEERIHASGWGACGGGETKSELALARLAGLSVAM